MTSDSLFGIPVDLDPVHLHQWRLELSDYWHRLAGRRPSDLVLDLELLRPIFGSGTSPKTIKNHIYLLPELEPASSPLLTAAVMIVDGCAVITPEGRILLEVLCNLDESGGTSISHEAQVDALDTALITRCRWHESWLRKQFESSVSVPVIGAALFLLVNGSIGEVNALSIPTDLHQDRQLAGAIMPLLAGLRGDLGKSGPDLGSTVRGHWAFTQVTRLFGRDVARTKTAESSPIFVIAGRQQHLQNRLDALLRSSCPDDLRRDTAIRRFFSNFREIRGSLAALDQLHEDPVETRRMLEFLTSPRGMR